MKYLGEPTVSETVFMDVWSDGFPNFIPRGYNTSQGKCSCCAIFGELRSSLPNTREIRQVIQILESFHRLDFMGERAKYYARRLAGMRSPKLILSWITDGMATSHTECPWRGNVAAMLDALPMKLQGSHVHARACDGGKELYLDM